VISELGRGILGHVFGGGWGEQIRRELSGLRHVALDLHFTLHESNLRVELAHAHILEISVSHSESGISVLGCTSGGSALTVLEINRVDEGWLGTLLGSNLETKDGGDLRDKRFAEALIQVSCHHAEDVL
jgi:hypothetical protein